jgi:hypothetical protein
MENIILYFSLGDFYVDIQKKKEDNGFMQHMIKGYFKSDCETVSSVPQTYTYKFELASGTADDNYTVICYGNGKKILDDTNPNFKEFYDTMWDILLK